MRKTTEKPDFSPAVYILHENDTWVEPLRQELNDLAVPFKEWFINEGSIDLTSIPPEGVFYNRMSASSHTRNHRFAVELTEPILTWLEVHNRRVVNNRQAIQLETRKMEQYLRLQAYGINCPQTTAAVGREEILKAADSFLPNPLIVKPNRGGKGKGVQLFRTKEELDIQLDRGELNSLDGIVILQDYIPPRTNTITRMEFINGQFYYAVQVDASGGFELCPADACQIEDEFCPADSKGAEHKFQLIDNYHNKDIPLIERFMKDNGIEIGAVEYVEDASGKKFYYDLNINTNYNSEAEIRNGGEKSGMRRIASFLKAELEALYLSV